MDSVSMDNKFQKAIHDSVEKNMKTFAEGKVSIFNTRKSVKEIKQFLYHLTMAIMQDLKARADFVSMLVESLTVIDIMSIKITNLEKRVKELEERSI